MLNLTILQNLNKGEVIAAEVDATAVGRRSWIGIYPFKDRALLENPFYRGDPPWRYRIRWFEVDVSDLESRHYDLDGDEGFIISRADLIVDSLDNLEALLATWKVPQEKLTFPYSCNYPM